MTYSKMVAGLMLSTTLLGTGATVLADTSSSSSSQSTTSAKATSSSSAANSSSAVAKTNAESTSTKKESKNDPVQTLKEQKMIIKKIVAKEGSQIATVSEANNSESKVDTSSASTAESTSNSSSSSSESKTDTPKGGTSSSSSNESTKPTTSSSSQAPGLNQSDFKGVPNSKFVVYDVTDTMNSVIKEKLGVDEDKANAALQVAAAKETAEDKEKAKASDSTSTSSSSNTESKASSNAKSTSTSTSGSSSSSTKETTSNSSSKDVSSSSSNETKDDKELISKIEELRKGDTIRKEVSERAAKLNKDQLKSVAEVTTDQNGTAETKLPIDGKYHAYYVVNTETAKESYATNSAPIVVITPVTDSQGMYAPEFTIYPKSNTLPKPTTPEETQAKMYQTGHEDQSFFAKIMNWFNGLFK